MRKPRDFDSELKALSDKARILKERRVRQLGELVIACQADTLSAEQLAGALIAAKEADAHTKEAWRKRGAAFFQRSARQDAGGVDRNTGGTAQDDRGTVQN